MAEKKIQPTKPSTTADGAKKVDEAKIAADAKKADRKTASGVCRF